MAVTLPFSTIDWTVAIVLIPKVTTTNPGLVQLILEGANGYASFISMNGVYNMASCGTYSGVPIYDNVTSASWGVSSSSAMCNPTAITAYGLGYDGANGGWNCFTSGCCASCNTGTFVADPFTQVFQMGSAAASGTWTLNIFDGNSGSSRSTLNSWSLQFYRNFLNFPPISMAGFFKRSFVTM